MKRRCIDGLIHYIVDIGDLGMFRTLCMPLGPGMPLYEYVRGERPITCLQCVIFSEPSSAGASHGASSGQK